MSDDRVREIREAVQCGDFETLSADDVHVLLAELDRAEKLVEAVRRIAESERWKPFLSADISVSMTPWWGPMHELAAAWFEYNSIEFDRVPRSPELAGGTTVADAGEG